MPKKLRLPPEKLKQLEGFEDIIDLLEEDSTVEKTSKREDYGDHGYQVYHYLENELTRLEMLNTLIESRLKTQKANQHIQELIDEQNKKNSMLMEDCIDLLLDRRSPMTKRLNNLWSNAFSLRRGR